MGGLIGAAVWFFIIYKIFTGKNGKSPLKDKKVQAKLKSAADKIDGKMNAKAAYDPKPSKPAVRTITKPAAAAKKASASGYKASPGTKYSGQKISAIAGFMEDRNNDWLARQLKEEKYLLSHGPLSDLGASHDRHCAADELKRSHSRSCDADGIDRGTA